MLGKPSDPHFVAKTMSGGGRGRQVHQLENAKTAWEEERKEVLVSSGRGEAVVSLAEERYVDV